MPDSRRLLRLLYLPLLALAASAPMSAQAETALFGGKTIKIIVGMPPGGGVDSYARLVQRHLGRFLSGSAGDRGAEHAGRRLAAIGDGAGELARGRHRHAFSSALLTEAISMPERVKVDFRSFASIGNVSEDIRICYTRGALGVRSWSDLLAREQVVFGATAPGTSGNVDTAMLRNLFGVKLKQVQGYAGSADKRLALEKGEIDGDCGGWTSIPEDWLRSGKINAVLRLSPTLVAGMDRDVPFGGDLLVNERDRKIYDFLTAPERLGRLFMVPAQVAGRIASRRCARHSTPWLRTPPSLPRRRHPGSRSRR